MTEERVYIHAIPLPGLPPILAAEQYDASSYLWSFAQPDSRPTPLVKLPVLWIEDNTDSGEALPAVPELPILWEEDTLDRKP